ncbi:tetratricopeptide repeat protein [bacterium]|nr:tetratricopeptide repeat protein [bacterium]
MSFSKFTITLFLFFLSLTSSAQNTDSLWQEYRNTSIHDTSRLNAMELIIKSVEFTNPDSAFKLADKMEQYARDKNLDRYIAFSLAAKGTSWVIRGNYQESIRLYKHAIKIQSRLKQKKKMAGCLVNTGICYNQMAMYDSAIIYYKKAIAICEEIDEVKFRMNALTNIGTTYLNVGESKEALDYFFKVIPLAKKHQNDNALAGTYANIGLAYQNRGNYAAALEYYDKGLLVHERLENPQGKAFLLKTIAEPYLIQKEYTLALKHVEQALSIARELEDPYLESSILINKSNILDAQGNVAESLKISRKALQIAKSIDSKQTSLTAYRNIGDHFYKEGDLDSAQYYFENSLKMSREIDNKRSEGQALISLGKISAQNGNSAAALSKILEGLEIAQELQETTMIVEATDHLVNVYASLGQATEAARMHNLYAQMKDSMVSEENTKATMRREYKFAYEKQALTDSLSNAAIQAEKDKEIQRRRFIGRGLTAGLLLVSLFAVVFFLQRNRINKEKKTSENLLHNILPEEVAAELKAKGEAEAKLIEDTTVLFTDFKGFTQISEKLTPKELVAEINTCFSEFDKIIEKYEIEKIKTIGDAYMAAGGLPEGSKSTVKGVLLAALEISDFVRLNKEKKEAENKPSFEIRIGINTGPVVAGIVGIKKFQYDIWGDTVNTASRMESSGEAGKVNISESTYNLIKNEPEFEFESRGKIQAKGKGEVEMYFVRRKA